jgi:hypothetical protein
MRKILLMITMVFATGVAFAQQPSKGAILIGGDLSFDIQKYTDKDAVSGVSTETNQVGFGFGPRGGYVLFDGFLVGATLDFFTSRNKFGVDKFTSSTFQAGPFVRYYLPFGLFGEVNFTGGVQSSEFTSGGTSSPRTTNSLTSGFLGAGFAYFLNSNVSLEPLLGYGFDRTKLDNNDTITIGGLRFRVSLIVYLKNE